MSELYDNLLKQIIDDEKQIDISRVCYTINNICKNLPKDDAEYHYNMIGSLIIHHYFISNVNVNETNISKILYNSQIMIGNKGILPAMEDLPAILQRIIAQYVINFSIS